MSYSKCSLFILILGFSTTQFVRAATTNEIRGVNDRGQTRALHHFELYGAFQRHADPNAKVAGFCHGVRVDGSLIYRSQGQINIAIPERPSGVRCSFQLEFPSTGEASNESAALAITAPEIEILGVRDTGISVGAQWFELYGRFPGHTSYQAQAVCDRASVSARIDYASVGQINVAVTPAGAQRTSCSLWLERTTDRKASPIWTQRLSEVAQLPSFFGSYFWGGLQVTSVEPEGMLPRGQTALRSAGLGTMTRFAMSPRLLNYGSADAFGIADRLRQCPAGDSFLACAAGSVPYQKAFATPDLRTIILTTYDSVAVGATGWEANFVKLPFLVANTERIRSEYRNLTVKLFETQTGTGKRFIISNWETDNSLYCAAYDYARNLNGYRKYCDETLMKSTPDQRIEAMTLWFKLRQEGIRQGRELATQRGLGGVEVHDAIEMASYRLLNRVRVNGVPLKDTLRNIIPAVRPDFVLYSAWDSSEAGRVDEDFAEIKAMLGGTPLLAGELGVKDMADPSRPNLAWRGIETIKAARRAGIFAAIIWQAFPTINSKDGLFDTTGAETQMFVDLRRAITADTSYIQPSHRVVVRGAIDRKVTQTPAGPRRFFELYGDFAGASGSRQTNYTGDLALRRKYFRCGSDRF